jgi:hypothetical protein
MPITDSRSAVPAKRLRTHIVNRDADEFCAASSSSVLVAKIAMAGCPSLMAARTAGSTDSGGTLVRINIGCGDRSNAGK